MSGQKDNFLALFSDICNGYTKHYIENINGFIFVKHPTSSEYVDAYEYYEKELSSLKKMGILCEEDQLKNSIDMGWWSKEKEKELNYLIGSLDRLYKTKTKLIYESDRSRIAEEISGIEDNIKKLKTERYSYIGTTAESVANQKFCDFFIENFFFSDAEFKENFILNQKKKNDENFDMIFDICLIIYYQFVNTYSSINIKKIALSHVMQNILFIGNNSIDIFGKPIINLTRNQYDLLIWAKYYQLMIKNTGADVPESVYEDPEKFNSWVELSQKSKGGQSAQSRSKKNKSADGSSKKSQFLFGEREEIETMTNSKINGDDIINKSNQNGGMAFMELLDS